MVFIWAPVLRPGHPPIGAVCAGLENGNELFACVVDDPSEHRFGKMGAHLSGGVSVSQHSREVSSVPGETIRVCSWHVTGATDEIPVWLPWSVYLDAASDSNIKTALSEASGVAFAVGRVVFRGATHPCAVSLDDATVRLLWGGKVHALDAFSPALELSILCSVNNPADLLAAKPCERAVWKLPDVPGSLSQHPNTLHAIMDSGAVFDSLLCGGLATIEDMLACLSDRKGPTAGAQTPFLSERPASRRAQGAGAMRVLVCHDFKGGYCGSDRGNIQRCEPAESYVFRWWSCVELFIYFAHRLVAVPPQEWIVTARRRGVPVLGTFLVEGAPGPLLDLLSSGAPDRIESVSRCLAELAAHYGFHGWLFNIEHHVPRALIERLLELLYKTTLRCRQMLGEHSRVLWYDAVTIDGTVAYQNALTVKNAAFFNGCDGLFTNYWWSEAAASRSRDIALQLKPSDGPQRVWMGTDVFGRNTFGGGGQNSWVGVEAAARYGLSSALFAPGWSLESTAASSDPRALHAAFRARDDALWMPIKRHIHRHECVVSVLPFATVFCPGASAQPDFAVFGRRAKAPGRDGWWCCQSLSDPVCWDFSADESSSSAWVETCDAYHGPAVLRLSGPPLGQVHHTHCALVRLSSKLIGPGCAVTMSLTVREGQAASLGEVSFTADGSGLWEEWEASGPATAELHNGWVEAQWILLRPCESALNEIAVAVTVHVSLGAGCTVDVGRLAVTSMGDTDVIRSVEPLGMLLTSRQHHPLSAFWVPSKQNGAPTLLLRHDGAVTTVIGWALQPYPHAHEVALSTPLTPETVVEGCNRLGNGWWTYPCCRVTVTDVSL